MKKNVFFLLLLITVAVPCRSQIEVNDSTFLFLDSLYAELPEVMIKGERPIVKIEEGKLVYDLPQLVGTLPVDNAYDALKELPGVMEQNDVLTLAGSGVNVVIDGKVSTLTYEQLTALLKSTPVSRIDKAEVMYSAPARYQVRGAMINLVLKKGDGESTTLQGELFTSWAQKHYERLTERASMLYTSGGFSTDLLYSYTHGRDQFRMEKEALHTVNGSKYPMNLLELSRARFNKHNVRWGMDYNFAKGDALSFVYTTEIGNQHSNTTTSGTETSLNRRSTDDYLHNLKLDYHSSFGLSAGAEFTFYETPGVQNLNSTLYDQEVNARYDSEQRINKWRFYATQEHALKNEWSINYGANYTTAVDNSHQYYYDAVSGEFEPDNSMKSRRREYIVNGFAGFSKNFGEKLSMDASLAAELFHSNIWDEWMFYPTVNLTYMPSERHIIQLSFNSDKRYPSFWELNNSVAYMSAYSEVRGNPDLKPSQEYQTSLSYILNGKYVLTAFYSYDNDYFVQTLYQQPDKLVEVYKHLNFDYHQLVGLQAMVPFTIKNWLSSRITLTGIHTREKDSDFWDIPFNRSKYSFIGTMNHTITLPVKPDIRLTISGFFQSGAIQGIYDLDPSGHIDASLRWTFAKQRAQLTLKGVDLFETSSITPKIKFEGQDVVNRFTHTTRGVELSFSYKFGNYKEREREEVDRSRFK